MADPLILSQLRAKASEIESHIESLSGRLANARSDLIHVMATIRMFDPSPEDVEPAKSYHSSARALTRAELFDRCKAALQASFDPKSTYPKMTDRQREMAVKASMFLSACVKVGLEALIDEATGYQYERAEDALQGMRPVRTAGQG